MSNLLKKKRKLYYGGNVLTPEEEAYYQMEAKKASYNSMAKGAIGIFAGPFANIAFGANTAMDNATSKEVIDPNTGRVTRDYNSNTARMASGFRKPTHEYVSESLANKNYGRATMDLLGGGTIWNSINPDSYDKTFGSNDKIHDEASKVIGDRKLRNNIALDNNTLSNYDTKGIYNAQIYKNGGLLKKKYLAGGELQPISDEAAIVNGPSHEQGGVDINSQEEVEGGEVVTVDGKVFSARSGFAQKALAITQSPKYKAYEAQKANYEKEANNISNDTAKKGTAKRNYEKLASFDALDKLFNEQMAFNEANGLTEENSEMKYGGLLKKKYLFGNEVDEFGNPIMLGKNYSNTDWNTETKKDWNINSNLDVSTFNTINNNNQSYNNPKSSFIGGNGLLQKSSYNNPLITYGNTVKTGDQTPTNPGKLSENPSPNNSINLNNNLTEDGYSKGNMDFDWKSVGSKVGNVLGGNNGNYGQYVDNAVNAYLTKNTPKIPNQAFTSPARLKTEVNITPQLTSMNNDFNALSKNLDRSTTGLGTALSNKQAAFSSLIKGKNALLSEKVNMETNLKNQSALNNQSVETQNNAIDYNNKFKQAERKGDIQNRISKNAANYADDKRFAKVDKQQADNDKMSARLYAEAMNSNGVVKRSPSMTAYLKSVGYNDEEIEQIYNKNKKQ